LLLRIRSRMIPFESSTPARPPEANGLYMKKRAKVAEPKDEMRPEYDFRSAVRAKYAERYRAGTNIVVLDPDVAAAFGNSAAVNRALRSLLKDAPKRRARTKRRTA